MFVLIGQNLHGTVTDVNQIDKHFNPFAASHHIVTKRPERFLFIVACFNSKSLPMFGGTSYAAGMCRSRIIYDRINPCIANQIQILEEFWNIFKFCVKFRYHRIIHAQKYRLRLQWIRYQLQSNPDSGIHKSGIINLCIGTYTIKCIQWFLRYFG